jgi:hypothetical protein
VATKFTIRLFVIPALAGSNHSRLGRRDERNS